MKKRITGKIRISAAWFLTAAAVVLAACGNAGSEPPEPAAQEAPSEAAGEDPARSGADSARTVEESARTGGEAEHTGGQGDPTEAAADAGAEEAEVTADAGAEEAEVTADAGAEEAEDTAESGAEETGEETDMETGSDPEDIYREMTMEEIEALYEPADEKVTLMVYLNGSDLESAGKAGTDDLKEMEQSGIDLSRVDLLVYTGGAKVWHSKEPEIPADANALYHLTEDGYELVETFEQLSMGDPASLTRFLQYSYENYPADSYDLILWDHGSGPVIGYGSDKQYGGDSLTLPEMKEALEASPFGQDLHLSMIGFDACLMSSAELACTLADYADYMVASQEAEPSFGWNYAFLGICGRISTEDLAKEIVREYVVYCNSFFAANKFFRSDITLAVIDLSYAGELEQAIDALFRNASNDVSGDYSKLAGARVHTHGFGRASTGSEYDLVDLGSLASRMEKKYPREVQQLREAVAKSVVANESNVGESCGISLFYPYYNKNYYRKNWKQAYQTLNAFPSYSAYLNRFDQVWLGTDLLDAFEDTLIVRKGEGAGTFTMQLTPEQEEQYASSRYFILQRISDNLYTVVYVSNDITDEDGLLTANFDGNIIYFSDDYGGKGIPVVRMYETIDNMTDYVCVAFAERPPEDPDDWFNEQLTCEIQFAVDTEAKEVTVKGIYEDDDEESSSISTGKKQPVDLDQWMQLCFYQVRSSYLTRDEQGRILPFFEWPESGWISYYEMPLANGLNFTYEPIYDDGSEYFIMFEVADVQNNRICSELLPISLAEAPPGEQAKDAVEIEWDGGSSVEFYNEDGLKAELCLIRNTTSRKNSYVIHAVNENDYGVKVSLGDLYVNDSISYRKVGRNTLNVYLDPGEENYSELEDINVIRTYAGIGAPETIQFTLNVSRTDNFGYIVYDRPYHVTLKGEITPESLCYPILGAFAEKQVLGEEDGIRVELLGLGRYVGATGITDYNEELTAKLKFTNLSGEERKVHFLGMEVNGIFFDHFAGVTLGDGESWSMAVTESGDDLRKVSTNYAKYGREDRIGGISEINFQVATGSSLYSMAAELLERGDGEPLRAEGELLYEDDLFRILLDSEGTGQETYGSAGHYWELWVENKSNRYLPCYLYEVREDGSEKYLTYTNLGYGCRQLIQVGYPEEELPGEEISVRLRCNYEDVPPTGLFALKVTR